MLQTAAFSYFYGGNYTLIDLFHIKCSCFSNVWSWLDHKFLFCSFHYQIRPYQFISKTVSTHFTSQRAWNNRQIIAANYFSDSSVLGSSSILFCNLPNFDCKQKLWRDNLGQRLGSLVKSHSLVYTRKVKEKPTLLFLTAQFWPKLPISRKRCQFLNWTIWMQGEFGYK